MGRQCAWEVVGVSGQSGSPLHPTCLGDVPRRYRTVLRSVAFGESNKRVATLAGLRESTVRQYVSELLVMFGVQNRTELALKVRLSDPIWRDLNSSDAATQY